VLLISDVMFISMVSIENNKGWITNMFQNIVNTYD
jgi:hypothetical protein